MAVYQIYKILFNRSRQGNLLSKMDGRTAYDKAQELLTHLLNVWKSRGYVEPVVGQENVWRKLRR